ncbi:hypothetical protein IJI86_01360 [Candidatus Saccharibacteria bacterium]|nr:hypothetical protein [Candidatus Saccharibacteria bacterium]
MSRGLCLHKKKILISIVIGFLGILVPSLCVLQNVAMAAGSTDAVITSILRCVEGGQFKSNMKASDLKGNASSFMSGSQKVYVPLGFSGSGPDATLSMTCKELVGKALTNKGINVPGTSTNPDEKVKFLKSLGYKADEASTASTKSCFWLKYNVYDLAESSTNPSRTSITQSICANVKDGKIADTDISIESTDNDYYLNQYVKFEYHSKKSILEVVFPGLTRNVDIPVAVGDSWDNLIQNVKLNVLNKRADFTFVTGAGEYRLNYRLIGEDGNANVQSGNASDINAEFTLTIDDASKRLITGTLTGGSTNVYPTFSGDDQFNMYQDYLRNYYAADIKCGATQDQIAAYYTESKGYYKVYSCTADDKMEPCYAKATKNAGKKVGGIDSARHFGSDCGFSCVANWLSNYGAAGDTCPAAEEPEPTTPTNNNNKPSSGSTDDRGFCDEAVDKDGGIGAMQWILCPTLDNTTYTAGWIDDITQKALEVDSSIYEPGSDLQTIWGDIRDIANVLMVLFFLVVVFSQLTGRGIDNYGIKKMLPRLIMMAIIVNLSYYICAIAVDASNIAGEGLRDLFGKLGGDGSGETNGFVDTVMALFGVGATGAGTAAGAASLAVTLGAGGWVVAVVIVIVLILVVIVALVVLWAMLGARLIIIIFCMVVSPLAFATFILPNTQNLFKKWWELFKAAIIIFPICGAVAGMSAALKKISLGGTMVGDAGQLVIIILPYLVFFLLPMLLKNAIAALGKVGGALTALGTSVRSGARNIGQAAIQGAKGTEAFKNRQVEAARNRQSESSRRTIERLEELKKQQGGKLNDTDTRRLARAHEVQRKLGLEDQAARTILAEKDFANLPQKQLIDRWEAAFDDGNTEEMDALTNVIASKGPGGVSDMAERLANKKIFSDDGKFIEKPNGDKAMERSFNALQANMLQNKTLATHMQNKAADAYQMVSGGGFGKDNVRHNMDYHTKNNEMATQIKDWATQSSSTIRRSAANGGLSQKMAQQILSSNDPAVQSGILSDSGKKAALIAAANGYTGDWKDKDSIANFATQFEGGMDANYINRSAESVADEAYAENARRSVASSSSAGGSGTRNNGSIANNPAADINIDHSGNGADEIPE